MAKSDKEMYDFSIEKTLLTSATDQISEPFKLSTLFYTSQTLRRRTWKLTTLSIHSGLAEEDSIIEKPL